MSGTWTNQSLSAAYGLWDKRQRGVLLIGMAFDGVFGLLVMLTPFSSAARSLLARWACCRCRVSCGSSSAGSSC